MGRPRGNGKNTAMVNGRITAEQMDWLLNRRAGTRTSSRSRAWRPRSRARDCLVFCGLAGRRLTATILAGIVHRAAARAGVATHVTVYTLRQTTATWLRQETGDARLVAAYLGHADLSTVNRHAHVAPQELHGAAEASFASAAHASRLTAAA